MKQQRFWIMSLCVVGVILIIWGISSAFNSKPSVLSPNNGYATGSVTEGNTSTSSGSNELPWDYQVVESTVGDLLDGDMVLLPNNERISNDQNFATGDKVWVLTSMSANMQTDSQGRNDVTLSQWKAIKTFKTKEEADKDISELKKQLTTEVNLVGVYKTELNGKFRYFAVVDMPTGQKVKQPISEERYASFKDKQQVEVILEEVHDYSNYDQVMAKFRGWAN
ncbi:hypothetical protein [Paenibacillus hexagrammi]|uniref:Signal peptide protein n=1 Tax=Paenibacillus hexagrammi TaxID=2908839 RepID=A0ABY3SKW3_9BACL|nr:hypothetical protein [Paenibacillus sp. YPD9-1]UJF34694.1 signal peptide protein [Paenibacillus sp. YPD9-1]